jgi:glycerate kinase
MERPFGIAAMNGVEPRVAFTDWSQVRFQVICDVTNPLLGEFGATAVYGPQKGADEEALKILEAGLANYAKVAESCLDIAEGCKEHPGAGAAGGVGYAGLAFLNAELVPGWKFFAEITSLEESVQWADLVITGEGSLDSQSLSGKVVSGVLNLASKYNKEVIIFCGVSKLVPEELGGIRCYSIASLGHPLDVCMSQAAPLLQQLAKGAVAF